MECHLIILLSTIPNASILPTCIVLVLCFCHRLPCFERKRKSLPSKYNPNHNCDNKQAKAEREWFCDSLLVLFAGQTRPTVAKPTVQTPVPAAEQPG